MNVKHYLNRKLIHKQILLGFALCTVKNMIRGVLL